MLDIIPSVRLYECLLHLYVSVTLGGRIGSKCLYRIRSHWSCKLLLGTWTVRLLPLRLNCSGAHYLSMINIYSPLCLNALLGRSFGNSRSSTTLLPLLLFLPFHILSNLLADSHYARFYSVFESKQAVDSLFFVLRAQSQGGPGVGLDLQS